jgi:hypothetical protein
MPAHFVEDGDDERVGETRAAGVRAAIEADDQRVFPGFRGASGTGRRWNGLGRGTGRGSGSGGWRGKREEFGEGCGGLGGGDFERCAAERLGQPAG